MKPIASLAFSCFLWLLMTGCGQAKKMSPADFPGTYVAKFSHGLETLVLNSDGTYEQRYAANAVGTLQTNGGKWEFYATPHSFVSLNNALLFDTRSNQPQIPAIRCDLGLNVKVWRDGQIELVINDEEGLGYRKQAHSTPGQKSRVN